MEYPKVLYKGVFDPEVGGLNVMDKLTVTSAKEEKDALKAGFVDAGDIESLRQDVKPVKKSKSDAEE